MAAEKLHALHDDARFDVVDRRHAADPQRARLPRGARHARPLPRPPAVPAADAADAARAEGAQRRRAAGAAHDRQGDRRRRARRCDRVLPGVRGDGDRLPSTRRRRDGAAALRRHPLRAGAPRRRRTRSTRRGTSPARLAEPAWTVGGADRQPRARPSFPVPAGQADARRDAALWANLDDLNADRPRRRAAAPRPAAAPRSATAPSVLGAAARRRRARPVDEPARGSARLLFEPARGRGRRHGGVSLRRVHILVATDADYVLDDITAALAGPDTSFTVCRNGRDVTRVVDGTHARPRHPRPADRLDGRHGGHDAAAPRRERRACCRTCRC